MSTKNPKNLHLQPETEDLDCYSEEEWAEIISYGRELADKSGYSWGSKGIPGKDKRLEERDVAMEVLNFLDIEYSNLVIGPNDGPNGPEHPPDIGVTLSSGARIGIEVKELVDERMRRQSAKRRSAERKLGLTPLEAARDEVKGRNPTPDHISRSAVAVWTPATVAAKIDTIVSRVEAQLDGYTDGFDQVWLAIFTNEDMISPEVVVAASGELASAPERIARLFVRFDYDTAASNEEHSYYPVVEIKRKGAG